MHTARGYGAWKSDAVLQLIRLNLPEAPKPARIECYFVNFASSDVDNLVGAVLDALVQGGVLGNDSSSYITAASGTFARTKGKRGEEKPIGVLVRILPAQIEYIDLDLKAFAA